MIASVHPVKTVQVPGAAVNTPAVNPSDSVTYLSSCPQINLYKKIRSSSSDGSNGMWIYIDVNPSRGYTLVKYGKNKDVRFNKFFSHKSRRKGHRLRKDLELQLGKPVKRLHWSQGDDGQFCQLEDSHVARIDVDQTPGRSSCSLLINLTNYHYHSYVACQHVCKIFSDFKNDL